MDELDLKKRVEETSKEAKLESNSKGYWGQMMHYFARMYDRTDSY